MAFQVPRPSREGGPPHSGGAYAYAATPPRASTDDFWIPYAPDELFGAASSPSQSGGAPSGAASGRDLGRNPTPPQPAAPTMHPTPAADRPPPRVASARELASADLLTSPAALDVRADPPTGPPSPHARLHSAGKQVSHWCSNAILIKQL